MNDGLQMLIAINIWKHEHLQETEKKKNFRVSYKDCTIINSLQMLISAMQIMKIMCGYNNYMFHCIL